MFCSLVNQVQFVCNLQRLKLQHPGEAATSVVPEHQETHRIVCMAPSLYHQEGELLPACGCM